MKMLESIKYRISPRVIALTGMAMWLCGTVQAQEKPAAAQGAKTLKLPPIFGDHMVLQRDSVAPVWGTANPGDVVTVTAGTVSSKATADANGKWLARLEKLPVSDTPIEVKVQGPKETIVFKDVLVGDVWFASGQSNMEYGINLDALVKAGAKPVTNPLIRVFLCEHQAVAAPTENIPVNQSNRFGIWRSDFSGGQWNMGISAVAYYFVRDLQAYTKHPVAIIQSAVSGSVAQTWLSTEALQAEPSLSKYAESSLKARADATAEKDAQAAKAAEAAKDPEGAKIAKAAEAADEAKDPKAKKKKKKSGVSEMNSATVNFNGGVNPYIPYGLKGVIWYQGESNSANPMEYRKLLPALIKDWRTRWGQDFSFLLVQLPTGIPEMAQAQAYIASLPNNGMCVTYDVGAGYSVPKGNSRVHFPYKSNIGTRLALVARKVAYGDDKGITSGPICKGVTVEGNKIRARFDQVGSGLKIGEPPADWCPKEPRVSTEALLGFEIAGADGKYATATAVIDGETIVASSPDVTSPTLLRYCWKDSELGKNNLYNKEGLPAAPFRSDELFPAK